jgi:hypothetical protein
VRWLKACKTSIGCGRECFTTAGLSAESGGRRGALSRRFHEISLEPSSARSDFLGRGRRLRVSLRQQSPPSAAIGGDATWRAAPDRNRHSDRCSLARALSVATESRRAGGRPGIMAHPSAVRLDMWRNAMLVGRGLSGALYGRESVRGRGLVPTPLQIRRFAPPREVIQAHSPLSALGSSWR